MTVFIKTSCRICFFLIETKLYETEIANLISAKNGFKMFERISKFSLITKPFEVGVELSAKQEIMRFRINDLYKDKISAMFEE